MTLYEVFFEVEMTLSERFTNLNPIIIRKEKAKEIFLLIRRLNNYTEKQNEEYRKTHTKSGKKVIRRKAQDDWF